MASKDFRIRHTPLASRIIVGPGICPRTASMSRSYAMLNSPMSSQAKRTPIAFFDSLTITDMAWSTLLRPTTPTAT
jgi:hypothetical protein